MSTVSNMTNVRYTKVGVFRNSFPVARYFFDIHVGEDGFAGFYMWKRNDYRFPLYHHLRDMMKRNSRNNKSVEEVVEADQRSFYVKFEDIQGVVTDRDHKEIQILSLKEEMKLLFRPYKEYDEFVETLKDNLGKRYFTRDDVEMVDSAYL